jgi:glycosyltransferase involved in cell wall biosynthesis
METITACIVAQDEELTIRSSITSLINIVDEILVFENGSCDNTRQVLYEILELSPKTPIKIFHELNDLSLASIRNFLEEKATSDWIMWWDADFIAAETSSLQTIALSELIFKVKTEFSSSNQVLFTGTNIGPTLSTDLLGRPIHGSTGDTQIVRKGFMRFQVKDYIDSRYYLSERKCKYLNNTEKSWFFHVDIKNPVRLAIRPYIHDFRKQHHLGLLNGNFGAYLHTKIKHLDCERLVNEYMKRTESKIRPYPSEIWGKLPEKIDEIKAHEPFELVSGELRLSKTGIKNVNDFRWLDLLESV